MKTDIYVDDNLVLSDNMIINPKEDNVEALGFMEGYKNFATLIIIPNFLRKVNPYREFSFKKYFAWTKSAYAGRFTVVTTRNVWYNDTYRNSRWERAAFHGL